MIDLNVGDHFILSYSWGGGPPKEDPMDFEVTDITGPCTCPGFLSLINERPPRPSPSHYHIIAKNKVKGGYCFNGYAQRGDEIVNVHRPNDKLIITERAKRRQLELFA